MPALGMPPLGAGAAGTPRDLSRVEVQLKRNQSLREELAKTITSLEQRIQPILEPEQPAEGTDATNRSQPSSLADVLCVGNQQLEIQINLLQRIIGRVEL